jgi:hypothetical protein
VAAKVSGRGCLTSMRNHLQDLHHFSSAAENFTLQMTALETTNNVESQTAIVYLLSLVLKRYS